MSRLLAATDRLRTRSCVDCPEPAAWIITRSTPNGFGHEDVTYRQPACHGHAWAMVADPDRVSDAVTFEPIGLALPGSRQVLTNGRAWVSSASVKGGRMG